ncbi:MAG: hypothetical protein H6844_15775 [Alphaproteobacteria bacterium]|nr:hypothetical protein [Alphaproteobacteria bacterium]
MRFLGLMAALAIGIGVSACANLQTVGRTTLLPPGENKTLADGTEVSSGGVAVHLDAQQRAIIQSGARYCAEPSPDALAAYAASLGLGASAPGTGAASASNALSSAAGSIGLRTQSIQLMRDALYRLCEARNNGTINNADMAMLLRRSQDLTAVVVAVEQLTGAVVAQQLALTGNANASASASLVANQQLLGEMEDQVAKKQTAVNEGETALEAAEKDRDTAADDKRTADAAVQADNSDDNQRKAREAAGTLDSRQRLVDNRQRDLDLRRQQLADAERVRDEVKAARDSALTNANAATGSDAQFGRGQQVKELDKAASEKIAAVVGDMVKNVLDKQYTVAHCMTYLTSPIAKEPEIVGICKTVLMKSAEKELNVEFATYGRGEGAEKLRSAIRSKKVTIAQLKQCMKDQGALTNDPGIFLNDARYQAAQDACTRSLLP